MVGHLAGSTCASLIARRHVGNAGARAATPSDPDIENESSSATGITIFNTSGLAHFRALRRPDPGAAENSLSKMVKPTEPLNPTLQDESDVPLVRQETSLQSKSVYRSRPQRAVVAHLFVILRSRWLSLDVQVPMPVLLSSLMNNL